VDTDCSGSGLVSTASLGATAWTGAAALPMKFTRHSRAWADWAWPKWKLTGSMDFTTDDLGSESGSVRLIGAGAQYEF
jgi:hypothetical protein